MKIGDIIGKYQLVDRIGRGGMGEVWLANAIGHGGFHKQVVLKTVLPELASDPMFVEMLAHEARVCGRLSHPNLVEVFDFSFHEGIYLLAMEHVTGWSLTQVLKIARERGWPIPPWFTLRIAWECCRGLVHAHARGVIHCDLSPSNVMLTTSGVTKILDFGVAHAAEHGPKADRLKGKFSYMAPERIRSLATDQRTDIYSLGVMLYLMFTERLPFTGETDAALMYKIAHTSPKPPSAFCTIDPVIEQVIIRAIQPDPAARQQTVDELLGALTRCLNGRLGAYSQDDAATFVSSLFGASDTQPNRAPTVRELRRAKGTDEGRPLYPADTARPPIDSTVELRSVDLEVDSALLAIPRETRPEASIVEPLTSWSVANGAKPHTVVVFRDPPARASVQSLFGERPSMVFGHSNVFTTAREPAPPSASPEPEWPWPRSRSRSR
jgi:serine/threonine protein kinase